MSVATGPLWSPVLPPAGAAARAGGAGGRGVDGLQAVRNHVTLAVGLRDGASGGGGLLRR